MEQPLQIPTHSPHAVALADSTVRAHFASRFGINSHADYLEFILHRSTAHLSPAQRASVKRTAGSQRSKARVFQEHGKPMIAIPVKDHRQGRTEWVTLESGIWLDVVENGADTAWSLDHKGAGRSDRQVRCKPPMANRAADTKACIARMIAGARNGQQVRSTDCDPLNLRRGNINIVGSPLIAADRVGTAKTDTRALLAQQA